MPSADKRPLERQDSAESVQKRIRQLCPDDPDLKLSDLRTCGKLQRNDTRSSLGGTNVQEQAMLGKTDDFWKIVHRGDSKEFLHCVQKDPNVLLKRGPVGETPLHMLVLLRHFELAKVVACRYPRLILDQYDAEDSPYQGETCLHIAIVHRDIEMVRLLLQLSKSNGHLEQLLSMKAVGKFFRKHPDNKDNAVYFGESPLGFAVSSNQPDIVRMLVQEYGASLEQEDSHENNVMHLAVEHQLPEMHDTILQMWEDWAPRNCKRSTPLTKRENREGFTPLCSAAAYGLCEMFNHMLEATCITLWSFGPITCKWLPLDGLDYVPGQCNGAIEHIIHDGHLDLLMLPLIQELLQRKWDHFAKDLFNHRFKWAIAQAVAFSVMVIVPFPASPGDDYRGALIHSACKLFLIWKTLGKMLIELNEIRTEGIISHFDSAGAAFFENIMSMVFCCSFAAALGLDYINSIWLDTALACGAISFWSYLLWFLLGFRRTGPLVVMVWKILTDDMVKFWSVTLVFLMGFSLATFAVATSETNRNWSSFEAHVFDFFHGTLSGFDKENFRNRGSLVMCILVNYSIIVTVLLLNILIAMLSDTYNKVSEAAEQEWNMERARTIVTIEKELKGIAKYRYWCQPEEGGERYLQFERTDATWARNPRTRNPSELRNS